MVICAFILLIDITYFSNFILLCSSLTLDPNEPDISKSGKHLYIGPVKNLKPWLITGLTNGDGSFSLKIVRRSKNVLGYSVTPL